MAFHSHLQRLELWPISSQRRTTYLVLMMQRKWQATNGFHLFLKWHEELCVKHGATNLSLSRALGSTKGNCGELV